MRALLIAAWCVCMLTAMPVFAQVPSKLADIAYGADSEQRLDVYLPEAEPHAAPMVVMVHGGAWRIGDKDNSRVSEIKSAHYAAKGYVFVSVNYRMRGRISPLEQAKDVVDAVTFIQAHAAQWGADPSRIVLMGHSAGAQLVGLIAAAPPALAHPWRGSVLLDSAAMDLPTLMQERHFGFYDRVFGRDVAFWRLASPYYQLNAKVAPMLLVCSTRRDISCAQAEAFVAKGHGFGSRMELLKQDMTHGEINAELGKDSDYTDQIDHFISSVL